MAAAAKTEVWTRWVGQVVNGIYPLRRFLGASAHSSVFLTESTTEGFLNAAIKLVPADPELTAVQLWHWKTAATFSHPHLLRLLDAGQCEIEGRPLLFVVMEYAEESLSQILPYRALESGEVRELLVPTLEALAFLHRENWVQGQLKPSNFLVVNDQLKLASDTIRPAGVARERGARRSLYDSPETERGEVSAAADVWALGVTLIEALTQYPPAGLESGAPTLPPNLPPVFADTLQQCLNPNPADRPTIAALQARTKPTPAAQEVAAAAPARAESTARKEPSARMAPLARDEPPPLDEPPPRGAPLARGESVPPVSQSESVLRATPHPYSPPFELTKRSYSTPTIAAARSRRAVGCLGRLTPLSRSFQTPAFRSSDRTAAECCFYRRFVGPVAARACRRIPGTAARSWAEAFSIPTLGISTRRGAPCSWFRRATTASGDEYLICGNSRGDPQSSAKSTGNHSRPRQSGRAGDSGQLGQRRTR